ncbi:MAG: acetyl-CoA carboxylase carboxyltransferase subunit beta [Nisaea sp.]|jgi:acetyl-CoA carboxylase carboxyl transferase subunit beta|uniref:acetyl-CoA carboxylase, carboxyltransferase subunit beta n=1 Tax=Nisaea sp. TaxID=2024842 RepID=UPI001B29BD54|nr:acetyl-CoA carboxylase, carboxyltransferase subunit beta [Nisaea sp.]MBO6560451.1 acetyl-CoA carboxylase carboxyltransferase subunit beta [Nisaea sp.]
MNWITNSVLPKIKALVQPHDVPENLWIKCGGCGEMIFHRNLEENQQVCPNCEHHMRLSAEKRLEMLFDGEKHDRIELPKPVLDPLKFRDRKRYTDRLKEAQSKTGAEDAIIVAHGKMGGAPVVLALFRFDFMGGSMGIAVGDALVRAAELAKAQKAPLVVFPASGGARMQEGILSLMQMPRTVIAREIVKEAGLPFVVVLTDPTTGGVTASFAMLGDIHIAEPGAIIGFAGQRVIQETIREQLPDGFQRSEYLLEHGMVDMVVHRKDLRNTLIRIFAMIRSPLPEAEVVKLPKASAQAAESTDEDDET